MTGSNSTTYRTHVAAVQGTIQQPPRQIFQAMEETVDISLVTFENILCNYFTFKIVTF